MEAELKQKWVAALRSGEYEQTKEKLAGDSWDDVTGKRTNEIGYCCLGVLCEVLEYKSSDAVGMKEYYIPLPPELDKDYSHGDAVDEYGNFAVIDGEPVVSVQTSLPEFLREDFGLKKMVQYTGKRIYLIDKLMEMNDGGKNFEDIANYLERIDF